MRVIINTQSDRVCIVHYIIYVTPKPSGPPQDPRALRFGVVSV